MGFDQIKIWYIIVYITHVVMFHVQLMVNCVTDVCYMCVTDMVTLQMLMCGPSGTR